MGRVRSLYASIGMLLALSTLGFLAGCGGKTASVAVSTIKISPATVSLEQGTYVSLTVSDNTGATVPTSRISWQVSNTSAASVGVLSTLPTVCAGTWDSVTNPTICTPGPAVQVQVTASADGATSPPTTIFIHQHIDQLLPSQVGSASCPLNPPPTSCLSGVSTNAPACFANYQVNAYNNGHDITPTIGPITWSGANATVASVTSAAKGLLFNQVEATARNPGQTQFFATAGNITSTPITFVTCPVESITLATAAGGTSLTIPKGVPQTITATVKDSAGLTLSSPPITWSSSSPTVATVSAAGVISGVQSGGAGVTASCIPTNCNIGFQPPSAGPPVYPSTGISVNVNGAASSTTAYAASSGCWDRTAGPVLGCVSSIIPVLQSSNKPGTAIVLPHIPTSMIMSPTGNNIYVGSCVPRTATGAPVCNGIAVVTASSGAVTSNNAVTGDVVGVSLNGNKAVISDTSTNPSQVFLYDQPSNIGTPLLLASTDHAKSAVFSPDGFLAYITTFQCTGSPCQTSNEVPGPVYVYDTLNGLRPLVTPAKVTDIALHPSGAFVYMAGIASNSVTALNTCTNRIATDPLGTQQVKATPGAPQFIRALPDGNFVVLNGPNGTGLEVVTAATAGAGCPPLTLPAPPLLTNTVSTTVGPLIDFNQGPLAASQFLVTADGSTALVVPQNFSSVFSYNLLSQSRAGIALVGGQPPTTGGLTSDGVFLYVGSTDGLLHVLNTNFSADTLQIVLLTDTTNPTTGMCSISTATQPCNPDFVVVKP
jgi:hypothetical protein